MIDSKDNYDIKYFENRWHIFYKNSTIPIPKVDYGSKTEAETGLEKELKYWNERNKDNIT